MFDVEDSHDERNVAVLRIVRREPDDVDVLLRERALEPSPPPPASKAGSVGETPDLVDAGTAIANASRVRDLDYARRHVAPRGGGLVDESVLCAGLGRQRRSEDALRERVHTASGWLERVEDNGDLHARILAKASTWKVVSSISACASYAAQNRGSRTPALSRAACISVRVKNRFVCVSCQRW